ncbi:PREDICTED: probable E3 ubiquitin-protein ligase HECTD2 isoform X2 [Priapulus caudatus]|uniref:HECT-type E3 ubiquitin transferase n=1 Tax=Priapulus caudatus TaxID=37621 RepID=A0ABM1E295_PRICU|nr:PREDICTED: probable E3 ubiquitin-protein ligase HECTD2 isoform X2 [Priapulus caudatus]
MTGNLVAISPSRAGGRGGGGAGGGGGGGSGANQYQPIVYPVRKKSVIDLRLDIEKANETKYWKPVQDFYATTFESFLEINAAFRIDPDKDYKTTGDAGIKFDYLYNVYDLLADSEVIKSTLKAVIGCLLKDKRFSDTTMIWPHTKDDLRAYIILLQNPIFTHVQTYVVFAHLLREVASLNDYDHHFIVHWFRKVPVVRFKKLITMIHQFVTVRLFPPKDGDLPPMSKCTWWIPSAIKVLALLHAANGVSTPPLINHTEFYNSALDHMDLMAEYYAWQNPSAHPGFSFCQYPFILSITAKRTIMQRDSEQQMIINARRSLVAKVQRRQQPDIGMLFLNLNIRRSELVEDSLNEIQRKSSELKKKLKVTFVGEAGLDMGGLTKEWFLLLTRAIFHPEYGMFIYHNESSVFWFNSIPTTDHYQEFRLVGVLMGLAVYNSTILDIRFPPCCYKKLLNPAVVPANTAGVPLGVCTMTLEDFAQVWPQVAKGLKDLLEYDGDTDEDFGLTFEVSTTEFGTVRTHQLKPGGDTIHVTNENREEYVKLYVDWALNKSIYHQFKAFYLGFHSVCASNALIMLRSDEIEVLVCGSPEFDMEKLKQVAICDGYTKADVTIKMFWDVVLDLPTHLHKSLLLFTTGSDRVPIGGMSEMTFKITRVDANNDMLPMSHTCFNQLVLPDYRNRKVLKHKLIIAISNAEGFGLE